ncbi:hypothetical protein SAMN04487946_10123 [Halobellus clavatus]|jgi:hypothetical protein|uniref:Uncharacterized protein n=1 Tax=Halobellus clavatus TaxID=660517 RepID=A0A1H3CHZ8_9EURY|nr:hypothetical protein SAMN04487946_10123 [Halobellus clavatus]
MRMGNLLRPGHESSVVMSANTPRLAVAHPTVVPGNHPGMGDADEAPTGDDPDHRTERSS